MFARKKYKHKREIDPDEIFMDSYNLPGFDDNLFEGRIEKPISNKTIYALGFFFSLIIMIFTLQIFQIQVIEGKENAEKSINNKLRYSLIFSDRGIVYDRKKEPLVWNENVTELDYQYRKYTERPGFAHLLGYVSYPKKDTAGFYYDTKIQGVLGIEKIYDELLGGQNGVKIVEIDAVNDLISDSTIQGPVNGDNLTLSVDANVQEKLFESIKEIVDRVGFNAGGGAIMDIHSGEMIAITTYPEFDSNIMTEAQDKTLVQEFLTSEREPFLNRITQGLYTPGSIMKPFVALGALQEKVVDKNTIIVSEGKMILPNPYNPDNPSIFSDWRTHGPVNVTRALALSSNIYFYQIGGGFKNQKGIGITNMNKYYKEFGFGRELKNDFFNYEIGLVPDPDWKKRVFDDDWRVGDTYFTAIGQYALQVTPIQVLRAIAAVANNGLVIEPKIITDSTSTAQVFNKSNVQENYFEIVKEGMREAVLDGTARGLNSPYYEIAAKTGTAELGVSKERVNSWIVGFFPYSNPKYAFTIVLESGDVTNLIGGVAVARNFFDWLYFNHPQYLK
jgi:penicillin-binding protein 2